jgi:hypothetical protein
VALEARLIEDRGAAAAEPGQFFRSPAFFAAEGVTHTLAIDRPVGTVALPVIVREIEGEGRRDAISPYGYPGATLEGPPPRADEVDWSATGLVSLFVRDRVGEPAALEGGTIRSELQIVDPAAESGMRKRLREQIRRNERRGWSVAAERGAGIGDAGRAAFEGAYAQTMERTGAAERYRYGEGYFRAVLGAESAWLLLAARDGEEPSAGAIAVASDRHLHYYLGGTAEPALADSPMKNLFAAMSELAGELGLRLNLGGGITPGDSLEGFKRGFANATEPFRTHEVVCDPQAYAELAPGEVAVAGGFFPAYRAPGAG